eukprot:jgi/Orpsp1_1/1176877/evm.model.c7180000059363.1
MITSRKMDISLFEELPIKLNVKRKEEISITKKASVTKNEKAKIYTPYPNREYQISLKKSVFEWKTMAYEHIRPNAKDFELVSE